MVLFFLLFLVCIGCVANFLLIPFFMGTWCTFYGRWFLQAFLADVVCVDTVSLFCLGDAFFVFLMLLKFSWRVFDMLLSWLGYLIQTQTRQSYLQKWSKLSVDPCREPGGAIDVHSGNIRKHHLQKWYNEPWNKQKSWQIMTKHEQISICLDPFSSYQMQENMTLKWNHHNCFSLECKQASCIPPWR